MTGRRLTRAQRVLVALHGTPDQFAEAIMRAIGSMISVDEAIAAFRKYRAEFEAAGNNVKEENHADTDKAPDTVNQDRG